MKNKLAEYLKCSLSILTVAVGIIVMAVSILVPTYTLLEVILHIIYLFGGFGVMLMGFKLFKYEIDGGG